MIKKMLHTGFTVRNLDASIDFYTNKLGFKLIKKYEEFEDCPAVKAMTGITEMYSRIAFLEIYPGADIELLEYKIPPSEVEMAVKPYTIGSGHISYHVDSLETEIKRLRSLGISINNPQISGEGLGKWVYFRDIDGIPIEISGE